LAIGVGRLGYSVGESLEIYGRLTIGDGLLAQIPAVLVSLAAGVLVSRIEALPEEEEGGWLQPAMLLVPALLLLGVGLVPGMPRLAFASVGAALLAGAWVATARSSPAGTRRGASALLSLRYPKDFGLDQARVEAALPSLRGQCEAATGVRLADLRAEASDVGDRVELLSAGRRIASVPLSSAHDRERAWLNAAYQLLLEGTPRQLNLSKLEAALERVGRDDPAALRLVRERVDLGELLALQRGFLRAGAPLPPLESLVTALAELPVFGERNERGRWPQRLREATAADWLPPLLEAHASTGAIVFAACEPDLVLALESCTRREQDMWSCSLDQATHLRARSAVLGERSAGTVVISSAAQRERLAAFFTGLHPRVPVVSRAEFDALGLERPAVRWLDERPYERALEPPVEADAGVED